MQEKKSLVEEALIQMKNVEEAISENAKGILASTMKEEINQLVKESLSEQDDEEDETDVDIDTEVDTDVDMMDTDNDDVDLDVDDMSINTDSDETPIDLTNASDEEILKVFKAMGEDDGIIVKKDSAGNITLKDDNTDSEYLVKLGESRSNRKINEMYENFDTETDEILGRIFPDGETYDDNIEMGEMGETMYEIEMDDDYSELGDLG
jgi:hypothetical protein